MAQGDQIAAPAAGAAPGATPASTPGVGVPGTATPGGGMGGAPGGAAPTPGLGGFFWIMIAMLGFMILMSVMTGRREKKKRAELLGAIKRKDKVITTAGIIGWVEEIGDHEVTLVVDQSQNTRIRFSKSAIQGVVESGRGNGGGGGAASSTAEVKNGKPVPA
jgi:preprotein translocase subunit YajC